MVAIGEWHHVVAGSYGRKLFLKVDGITNHVIVMPRDIAAVIGDIFYFGKTTL